ncbi:chemerin-like receptor 1 [Dendropsophus ebraccatus]|uniref:chemerin-like receptor 1 n=1 Tax=Dendropsophus ebraccatus TaxID=150705 RepID=UPI0038318110
MENVTLPDYNDATYNYAEDTEVINPKSFHIIQIISIIFYSIFSILGITQNAQIIWIAGFKTQKTVTVLWFLNMAIADFIFDMTFPLQITEWIMDGHWLFGRVMCKVVFTILFLNTSVSTSFLMITDVDWCMSVMCPMWSKNHRSPRLALTISAIIWLICFILTSPDFGSFDIVPDSENSTSYCTPLYDEEDDTDTTRPQTLIIIRCFFFFLIPFLIILIRCGLTVSRSLSICPLKVIITMVLNFFCLNFPIHSWPLLQVLNIEINPTADMVITHLVYCIALLKSCINPSLCVSVGRHCKKHLFFLENTFKKKDGSNSDPRINQTNWAMMETEMESLNL